MKIKFRVNRKKIVLWLFYSVGGFEFEKQHSFEKGVKINLEEEERIFKKEVNEFFICQS